MPLIGMKDMLDRAYAGGYAVGGFDGFNAETFQAVIETGREKRAPLLAICAPVEYALLGAGPAAAVARALADFHGADLCLHLDHADSMEQIAEAVNAGFTSVMIDGSQKPFEANIALTAEAVRFAHARGVPVEAELGALGRVDKVTHEGGAAARTEFTDPALAAEFVERTGCDFLAVSIGNAHGLYASAPSLDFDLLRRIRDAVPVPLVLHGGSGTPEEQLTRAVGLGIAKVNVASEIARAFTASYVASMSGGETWWTVAKKRADAATREVIARWMDMLGSSGKAD